MVWAGILKLLIIQQLLHKCIQPAVGHKILFQFQAFAEAGIPDPN